MKKINTFFFGEEKITSSDFLWFYGTLGVAILLTLLATIPVWMVN